MTKPEVRLALCGAGRWGKRFLETIKAESLAADPSAAREHLSISLKALVSRNPESKSLVPVDCEVLSSWQQLLMLGNIDGVIIATPPAQHFEIAKGLLEKGLPCLIEKPLTTNLEEARQIEKLAIKNQTLTMVDHTLLFHPAYAELKKRVGKNKILKIESVGCNRGPFRKDYTPLFDYGPHDVAFALDLAGAPPEDVDGVATNVSEQEHGGHAGRYELNLTWASGTKGHIIVSNVERKKRRWLKVDLENTAYVFDDLAEHKLYELKDGIETALPFSEAKPLTCALKFFAQAIEEKLSPLDPRLGLELAVQGLEVLTRCHNVVS